MDLFVVKTHRPVVYLIGDKKAATVYDLSMRKGDSRTLCCNRRHVRRLKDAVRKSQKHVVDYCGSKLLISQHYAKLLIV